MKQDPKSHSPEQTPFERFQELAKGLFTVPKEELDKKPNGKQNRHKRKKTRKVKPH